MTIEQLREEMEYELTWRTDELRMLKNNLSLIFKDEDKNKYRKSLIVMLYAHFEGFTKTCFNSYVSFINAQKLKRYYIEEKPELIASCMNDIFKAYDDKDRKNKVFKRQLPDDKKLHATYRRADLISQFNNFLTEEVYIKDDVIKTDSNLKSHVLSRNLYYVGINPSCFNAFSDDIDNLVNLRNGIAHGSDKSGIDEKKYNTYENIVLKNIMESLIQLFQAEAKEIIKIKERYSL